MENDKNIQKGFNAGYLLAKHRPELSKKLLDGLKNKNNPYVLGLLEGSREYDKEKNRVKKKERPYPISKIRNHEPKDKDTKEKDIGSR